MLTQEGQVQQDSYLLNGQPMGEEASMLHQYRLDKGWFRPYWAEHNGRTRACLSLNTGRMVYHAKLNRYVPVRKQFAINDLQARGIPMPITNATTLRKEEWIMLDQAIVREARLRLRAWADLAATNTFGGFNGMAKMILEHEMMSDPGNAVMDMDGTTASNDDNPAFALQGIPLYITHSDFYIPQRLQLVSENTGTPLSVTKAEAAARRVAETIEQVTIGTLSSVTYGGNSSQVGGYVGTSTAYGYANYPYALTYTSVTAPTANGYTKADTLAEVLHMIALLRANRFYGPYMLYHSTDWDEYMDNDYILTGGNVATQTLRERLKKIEGIQDVRRLDFLGEDDNPFHLILVQMTPDVARAVNGMDLTTVQWPSQGNMRLNFKVMCIQVPQLRCTYSQRCGILVGTTS